MLQKPTVTRTPPKVNGKDAHVVAIRSLDLPKSLKILKPAINMANAAFEEAYGSLVAPDQRTRWTGGAAQFIQETHPSDAVTLFLTSKPSLLPFVKPRVYAMVTFEPYVGKDKATAGPLALPILPAEPNQKLWSVKALAVDGKCQGGGLAKWLMQQVEIFTTATALANGFASSRLVLNTIRAGRIEGFYQRMEWRTLEETDIPAGVFGSPDGFTILRMEKVNDLTGKAAVAVAAPFTAAVEDHVTVR